MTSPMDLWAIVLKPHFWHFGYHHLVFLKPEVPISGQGGGVQEKSFFIASMLTNCRLLNAQSSIRRHTSEGLTY